MPPIIVNVKRKDNDNLNTNDFDHIPVYINQLRQYYITSIPFKSSCTQCLPYLTFDSVNEEDSSRRQQKPIIPNLMSTINQKSSELVIKQKKQNAENKISPHQSRPNSIKSQIKKNDSSVASPPLVESRDYQPESQLSYEPMKPNAELLPEELRLNKSKPINSEEEE
jgi:hypothetical protein